MTLVPCDGFCLVLDQLGRVKAQGRREMCELIIAGLPLFANQGALIDGH